jgi:hypothetical protein
VSRVTGRCSSTLQTSRSTLGARLDPVELTTPFGEEDSRVAEQGL